MNARLQHYYQHREKLMEVWKPIRQNNNYQVSNYGRVRTYNYTLQLAGFDHFVSSPPPAQLKVPAERIEGVKPTKKAKRNTLVVFI